jgi:hypothetical protein
LYHYKNETSYSFPTPINLFETTPKDENQQRPEVQIHLAIKNKQVLSMNEGEKRKLNAVLAKENTRRTIRMKTRVFLAMKTERASLQNKHDVIQPFIAANKIKEN